MRALLVLKHKQTLKQLQAEHCQPGKLEWIGLRASRRGEITPVRQIKLIANRGLEGDHYAGNEKPGKRQVTLIQAEHLPVIAALCQRESIDPSLLRRNLVVSGINLLTLKQTRFRIGNALLEGTGQCHPCSRMTENLDFGGYNAVRGHGGITACVLEGAIISVGDEIKEAT